MNHRPHGPKPCALATALHPVSLRIIMPGDIGRNQASLLLGGFKKRYPRKDTKLCKRPSVLKFSSKVIVDGEAVEDDKISFGRNLARGAQIKASLTDQASFSSFGEKCHPSLYAPAHKAYRMFPDNLVTVAYALSTKNASCWSSLEPRFKPMNIGTIFFGQLLYLPSHITIDHCRRCD